MLHATALEFLHPVTKAPLLIRSPLPADFEACLRSFRV
jgi:23S rRNA-/tRNA-specific pseudouridylate synthase